MIQTRSAGAAVGMALALAVAGCATTHPESAAPGTSTGPTTETTAGTASPTPTTPVPPTAAPTTAAPITTTHVTPAPRPPTSAHTPTAPANVTTTITPGPPIVVATNATCTRTNANEWHQSITFTFVNGIADSWYLSGWNGGPQGTIAPGTVAQVFVDAAVGGVDPPPPSRTVNTIAWTNETGVHSVAIPSVTIDCPT
jgi:hypothetical protein